MILLEPATCNIACTKMCLNAWIALYYCAHTFGTISWTCGHKQSFERDFIDNCLINWLKDFSGTLTSPEYKGAAWGPFTHTVISFCIFKNGFNAVRWCGLHTTSKRSKVPLIETMTLTVCVNEALGLFQMEQGNVPAELYPVNVNWGKGNQSLCVWNRTFERFNCSENLPSFDCTNCLDNCEQFPGNFLLWERSQCSQCTRLLCKLARDKVQRLCVCCRLFTRLCQDVIIYGSYKEFRVTVVAVSIDSKLVDFIPVAMVPLPLKLLNKLHTFVCLVETELIQCLPTLIVKSHTIDLTLLFGLIKSCRPFLVPTYWVVWSSCWISKWHW